MIPSYQPRPPAELRTDVRGACENRPGVYRMLGPMGELLYVGKSKRVRTRLLSYFRASENEKATEIIRHTHRIEWDYVPSEFAAVLHEMRLIQDARPPFNVEHKRDRAFCFVKITAEAAARLTVASEVAEDGAIYFGPFHGRQRVREMLRDVSDLLELRDCKGNMPMRFADQLDLFGAPDLTPGCIRADVHKCLGPCAGRTTRAEYQAQVELAHRFLDGDADTPLAILQARMNAASERMHFEYAAQVRDRAARLQEARAELLALRGLIDSLSFIYCPTAYGARERVYVIHRGAIRLERDAPDTQAEREELVAEARRIFRKRRYHSMAVKPTQVAEILLLARWFRLRPEEKQRTWAA